MSVSWLWRDLKHQTNKFWLQLILFQGLGDCEIRFWRRDISWRPFFYSFNAIRHWSENLIYMLKHQFWIKTFNIKRLIYILPFFISLTKTCRYINRIFLHHTQGWKETLANTSVMKKEERERIEKIVFWDTSTEINVSHLTWKKRVNKNKSLLTLQLDQC